VNTGSDRAKAETVHGKGEKSDLAFIYGAIVVGALAICLDFASVDLALPALEAQYGPDLEGVQWVINGYILAFAVFMVAGGRLADAYGRKNIFLVGMGIFAIGSLLGGMTWSDGTVIGFRVLQGIGAALLWPAMMVGLRGCRRVEPRLCAGRNLLAG
jgi:MFS family permease